MPISWRSTARTTLSPGWPRPTRTWAPGMLHERRLGCREPGSTVLPRTAPRRAIGCGPRPDATGPDTRAAGAAGGRSGTGAGQATGDHDKDVRRSYAGAQRRPQRRPGEVKTDVP